MKYLKSSVDIVQSLGIALSLAVSMYALYDSSRTSTVMQCFQETVPKQINKLQSFQDISREISTVQLDNTTHLIELQMQVSLDGSEEILRELLYEMVRKWAGGIAKLEQLKTDIKPLLTSQEFNALSKGLETADGDYDTESPDASVQAILTVIKNMGVIIDKYNFAQEFLERQIRKTSIPSVAEMCGRS